MGILKRIKQICTSTILCIKYPFLYPRNRFTDTHYTNWALHNKICELRKNNYLTFTVGIYSEDEYANKYMNEDLAVIKNKYAHSFSVNGKDVTIGKIDTERFRICIGNKKYVYNIADYMQNTTLKPTDVDKIFFSVRENAHNAIPPTHIIFILKPTIEKSPNFYTFNCIKVLLNRIVILKIKSLVLLSSVLAAFHFLPSYTELDAMDKGWKIRFGEDICKEIRNSLLLIYIKNEYPSNIVDKLRCYYKGIKRLFSYRIQQIKEKYGSLRWYAYGNTEDTLKIIEKYEKLSEHTCIICGKEATYRSTGWICPYCDNHSPEGRVKIGEENEDEY